MYATGFRVDGMDGREKLTIPQFFGRTEVRDIGEIPEEEEDRRRNAGDGHVQNHMMNMMNQEKDFDRAASAARLDVS
jgi:hypothetical protein